MTVLNRKGSAFRQFQQNPDMAAFRLMWDAHEKMPQVIQDLFGKMRQQLYEETQAILEEQIRSFGAEGLDRLKQALRDVASNMKKGDPGYTPVEGIDYFTESEKESFIASVGRGIRIPDPIPGKDADEDKIVENVLASMPKYDIGKVAKEAAAIAVTLIPEQEKEEIDIVKEISSLPNDSIELGMIKGLTEQLENIKQVVHKVASRKMQQVGGGDVVTAGAGVTITRTPGGKRQIAASGSAVTIYQDTVSGTVDGANVTFTVPNAISAAIMLILGNSSYQLTTDYTVSGTTITFLTAPDASLSGQPFFLVHT